MQEKDLLKASNYTVSYVFLLYCKLTKALVLCFFIPTRICGPSSNCWYFAVVFVQPYLHLYDNISSNRWSDNWFSCFSLSASHTELFLCVCSSFACHGWAVISVTLGAMGGLWSLLLWVPWVGCDFCYFGCHGWAVISVTLGAMGGLWSL